MKSRRKTLILFGVCNLIVFICLILIICLSGFLHESRKFRALLFVIVVVLFFHCLIGDFIKFLGYACYAALRKKPAIQEGPDVGRSAATNNYDEDALVRLQLASHEAAMHATSAHYNESLNLKYKLIINELRLYGLYFLLLMLLVVGSRDYLTYYNTHTLQTVFLEKRLDAAGLYYVHTPNDVYDYIRRIVVKAFNQGRDYNEEVIEEPGWIQYNIAKLLGVVRLRQVRRLDEHIGLDTPSFDERNFMPRWRLPYEQLHYISKYIHTYGPWLEGQVDWNIFTPRHHYGNLHTYAENNGYVTFLSRDLNNSLKILEYLKASNWIDARTAGVFIDFTLYNVDSNIFSVCTILLEYTPFGNVLSHVDVQSVELLMNLDNVPGIMLLVFLLYLLTLIYFAKHLVLNMLYKTKMSSSPWNVVDFVIIALNLFILILIIVREAKVAALMARFEDSMKLEFVDFRVPAQIDYLANLMIGFLICLTTLRLWKIFQFAKPFRVFTRTLYRARFALLTLLVIIVIWLIAFGISSYIINGNDSEHFTHLFRSFAASMSYSFGFSSTVSPYDLTYGGLTLGFILYALLMFVIAIVLLNLFITLICDYFAENKNTPDDEEASELGFYEFLRVEFGSWGRWCKRTCCSCCEKRVYDPKKRNVKQRIDKSVADAEKKAEKRKLAGREDAGPPYGRHLRDLDQVRAMARKMNAQIALLRRHQRWRRR
ncbi:polycystic kidney disease protein 1-like 2 [Rhagoletis pomonella]|uniref:polycystic kidney disease protein 1-like 2 n=1 Tax=Rhagoletis pomonella TaxID=28610 RepID=UPI00177ADCEE|nr:polycystic kidney disease protein 1-like 2 [Rhagoletis pomonella]